MQGSICDICAALKVIWSLVAWGPLENDMCNQNTKNFQPENMCKLIQITIKSDLFTATWIDYGWYITKICLEKMEYIRIHFNSQFQYPLLWFLWEDKVPFFFFLHRNNPSGNASSTVIKYPCTKHISRACNPLPPNLRVTFNNNLALCRNNTFAIVNFASCFQT